MGTKKKDKSKYKLQQQAKLQNVEQEMVDNYKQIDTESSKQNNIIKSQFNDDKASLQSTLIIIAELIIYTFIIMVVTYYCCYIKRNKNASFSIKPSLIGNKRCEN